MVTVQIQIKFLAEDFSVEDPADFFTETLPSMPQIGEQILTRKVREKIAAYLEAFDVRSEYLRFGDYGLSFVSAIAHCDNGICICLSSRPGLISTYIYSRDPELPACTWTTLPAAPSIGDRISLQTGPSQSSTGFVQELFWTASNMLAILVSAQPVTPGVEVQNNINATITNTVSTDTYINNTVDVEVVNPVNFESHGTIDVNVKKFDHGYIYVRSDNDRY